jgi:hypothetical protein
MLGKLLHLQTGHADKGLGGATRGQVLEQQHMDRFGDWHGQGSGSNGRSSSKTICHHREFLCSDQSLNSTPMQRYILHTHQKH